MTDEGKRQGGQPPVGKKRPRGQASLAREPRAAYGGVFPCEECLPGCAAREDVQDVLRLLTTDLTYSQFIDGHAARRLIATMLIAYRNSLTSARWREDPFLAQFGAGGERLAKVMAAIFDFATNVEYCSERLGRVVDSKWIYCNAAKGTAGMSPAAQARVFYSFLKQCPYCCTRVGLGARIEGAQHKPASHHIGEITGSLMAMLLAVIVRAAAPPLTVGLITKQSHSVDALCFRANQAVLLEIKASPLVTLPIASDLAVPMRRDLDGERVDEYAQHALVDFQHTSAPLYFLIPHRDTRIELGVCTGPEWPYPSATAGVATPDLFLDYLSGWHELYAAYAVPKTERLGRVERVAYLTNGWGDEIDSNKTKPGLGRTDDLKKGTYQVLKYGADYKDLCARRSLYTALVTNLDPVNLRADYLERLLDVRWTKERHLKELGAYVGVPHDRLYHLFEAIVAFNQPVVKEPALRGVFDFDAADRALLAGDLDTDVLKPWMERA